MALSEGKRNQAPEIHEQFVHPQKQDGTGKRLIQVHKRDQMPATIPQPEIICEDETLVAVCKPAGMLTLPDRYNPDLPSLKHWMEARYDQIYVVHRLDRDTSGLILFAKTAAAHQYFSGLFESRKVEKKYLGLVEGTLPAASGTFDQPIAEHPRQKGKMTVHRKGKPAITHFQVLETFGRWSWVEFRIETGRTHQIRVHLQNAGHPLAADPIYGTGQPIMLSSVKNRYKLSKSEEGERPLLGRLALHAAAVAFTSQEGKLMQLEAALPKDIDASLKQLRKWIRNR
jgi:23S rRNA pseudouridine955/2504/2580 synthase/23S rRNA pseudouridine1911/1915/1917 synthase